MEALCSVAFSIPELGLVVKVWLVAVVGLIFAAWCAGWLVHEPAQELAFTLIRSVLTLGRVLLYCCPGCHKRDPHALWDGQIDVQLRPHPRPPADADLQQFRIRLPRNARPPGDWQDPVPRAEEIDAGDRRAPFCFLLDLLRGRRGRRVEWRRAVEIVDGVPTLFGEDGPNPLDIEQGNVGDCYFLSAIAALAEDPPLIRRLFLQTELAEDGIYCVFIAKHGTWHEMWIDDVVPMTRGEPFMSRSKETGKLWPLLLEKAWVASFGRGDYMEIDAGYPQFPLHALTNCPVVRYDVAGHSLDALWGALASDLGGCAAATFCAQKPIGPVWWPPVLRHRAFDCRDTCLCCSWAELLWTFWLLVGQALRQLLCCPVTTCRLLDWIVTKFMGAGGCSGIIDGHAYSVLGAMEVPGSCGMTTERLVKLRNPWGDTEWTGRYSDRSWAWTDEARQLAKLEQCDDGVFFMEWADFTAYFAVVAICYTRPGGSVTPLPLKTPELHRPASGGPVASRRLPAGALSCIPSPDCWHWSVHECVVDCSRVGAAGWTRRLPECGVQLVVPAACQLFVTVDDPTVTDPSGFYEAPGRRRCVLVFERGTRRLVGRNQPLARDIRLVWNPLEDTGTFDELTSQSTTRMDLLAGRYLVEVCWRPGSRPEAVPERLVFILTASAPGLALEALPEDAVRGGGRSGGESDSSESLL